MNICDMPHYDHKSKDVCHVKYSCAYCSYSVTDKVNRVLCTECGRVEYPRQIASVDAVRRSIRIVFTSIVLGGSLYALLLSCAALVAVDGLTINPVWLLSVAMASLCATCSLWYILTAPPDRNEWPMWKHAGYLFIVSGVGAVPMVAFTLI